MNNLIINGIDHSVFYLEWAKRGGVVIDKIIEAEPKRLLKYIESIDPNGTGEVYYKCARLGKSTAHSNLSLLPKRLRMATPSEAGIEYIEPPARWQPIDTLTTDIPTPLLVCDEKSKQIGTLIGQNIFGGACISGWDDHDTKPTHWMPPPQPPKDE